MQSSCVIITMSLPPITTNINNVVPFVPDLFLSTWRAMICHIVNLAMSQVDPKDYT